MRAVVEHARAAAGETAAPGLILGVADADAFGALAAEPTLVIEAGAFAARKLAAIKCHDSQMGGCALALVEARDAERLIGLEHYRRAGVGGRGPAFIERFGARS
jgi:hypothetical protein